MINKELKLKYIKSLKSGGRVPKYLTAWGRLDKQDELDDWTKYWLFRTTPLSNSKILGGWKPGSRNGHAETDKEYTARRTKEESDKAKKETKWLRQTADMLHAAGVGLTTTGLVGSLVAAPVLTLGGLTGGITGEKLVDRGLEALAEKTGSNVRSWKDLTLDYLGWSPTLLIFSNPGTLIGGGIGAKGAQLSKGAMDYLIAMDMARYRHAPTTQYYFKPGYLGANGNVIGKVPEGAKVVGELKGEPLIEINGKKYLLSKYNELHGGIRDLGYNPTTIAAEALQDFIGPLARIIDNSEILTDLANKIKRGEATTEFSRNKGTLVSPNARDVLAGELADVTKGKQKRGVALVNTMPTNITTTGLETYAGRGNFGLNSFSVTNHPGAVRAYGAINYPKLTQYIKESKILTDQEKNNLYSYLKEMKKIDGDPLSRMTENTDVKLKLSPEEDTRYLQLIAEVNKLIPGTFEYGGLNRHILYPGLKDSQIINVSSTSDKFGASGRNVERELLPLLDFLGHRLMTFNPKYDPTNSRSVELVHNGYVGNILEAERLIGGYKYKNKFGNWDKESGWNQTPNILETLRGLLYNTNGKFYVRGVGPNGVPGAIDMITLLAPNGGIPGFKKGHKLNYYKK